MKFSTKKEDLLKTEKETSDLFAQLIFSYFLSEGETVPSKILRFVSTDYSLLVCDKSWDHFHFKTYYNSTVETVCFALMLLQLLFTLRRSEIHFNFSARMRNCLNSMGQELLPGWSDVKQSAWQSSFSRNPSSFSGKSWQSSTNINIQWVETINCQFWQDSASIWQKMTNYRKPLVPCPGLPLLGLTVSWYRRAYLLLESYLVLTDYYSDRGRGYSLEREDGLFSPGCVLRVLCLATL